MQKIGTIGATRRRIGLVRREEAIDKHFEQRAGRIKDMAMPEARERLLADNEAQREQMLKIFREQGHIYIYESGMHWTIKEEQR